MSIILTNEAPDIDKNFETSTRDRYKAIYEKAEGRMKSGLDEATQYELALLFNLFPYLIDYKDENLVDLAEVVASALLSDTQNVMLAHEILVNLQNSIFDKKDEERNHRSPWRLIKNPAARVGTGIVVNVILSLIYGGIFFMFTQKNPDVTIFGVAAYDIALVTIMGMFGSVTSLLLRINDFSGFRGEYPSTLFFIGFIKPLIGALFALFTLTLIKSEALPVNLSINVGVEKYFFAAVSFVTGFSERFARDLIIKTEEAVV